MNAAIIGCGLIGQKRSKALGTCNVVACADLVKQKADALAKNFPGAFSTSDWREAVSERTVDIVIVATTHEKLAEITTTSLNAGKHVLVEKPAARSAKELEGVMQLARTKNLRVHVGFNHRYHPAFLKAKELVASDVIGIPLFVRGRYGHGGRIGYEKEWRANPSLSGGGELIDQGVHLIDLSRWFLGDFTEIEGFAHNYFWNMPVEDNGFMILKTLKKQVAFLHASCTEWKNQFSFEIFCRNGKIDINGLGGSYGIERITLYKMLPEMGPPETTSWEYPRGDFSWELEFKEFLDDIKLGREPSANLADAYAALTIVEHIYRKSGYDYHT
jgi:predicted dehydrogenase